MASVGKDRPNLKICIDNTDEPSDAEEASDSEDDPFEAGIQVHGLDSRGSDDEFEISVSIDEKPRPRKPTLEPRRYENKSGNFVTGIDVTSKEEVEKKILRGKRFGVKNDGPDLSDTELNKLYESLGIDPKNMEKNERGVRLEAIHMRGTDEMSTKDVFHYFQEFGPGNIEWIDDISCNIVWDDRVTAARALIKLSSECKPAESDSSSSEEEEGEEERKESNKNEDEPMETDYKMSTQLDPGSAEVKWEFSFCLDNHSVSTTKTELEIKEKKEEKDDYDELDLMSTDEDDLEDKETGEKECTSAEKKNNETEKEEATKQSNDNTPSGTGGQEHAVSEGGVESVTVNIKEGGEAKSTEYRYKRSRHRHRQKSSQAVPPGHWRMGVPCKKAKHIFLRYATKADKKLPGAEKRSKYYQKHGNPNFGGIKGILTETKKRSLRKERWKHVNDEVLEELEGMAEIEPELDDTEYDRHMETVERERKQAAVNRRLKEKGEDPDPPPLPLPPPNPVSRKRKYQQAVYSTPFYSEDEEEEEDYAGEIGNLEEGEILDVDEEVPYIAEVGHPVTEEKTRDEEEVNLELQLQALLEPPEEKRYMRMHADDEEEKLIAKRKNVADSKQSLQFVNDARSRIRNRKRDRVQMDGSPPRKQAGDLRSRIDSRRQNSSKEKLPKLTVEVSQEEEDDIW